MYDRILFPTDGSEAATEVFDHVVDIAETHGASVAILYVADTAVESVTTIRGKIVDALEQEGERIVEETAERADDRHVSVGTEVRQGRPDEEILGYAREYDIDLVVMPTHGRRGVKRVLLGSVTERVLRRSDVPVLTIRPDEEIRYPYRNVLHPTDGSECARTALEAGIDVVNIHGAQLHLLSVITVTTLGYDAHATLQLDALEEHASTIIDEAAETASASSVASVSKTVEYGSSISGKIRSYIDEHDIDLVVIGTHGRSGFDRYFLGSVTEQLVRTSPVPVLTVRGAMDQE